MDGKEEEEEEEEEGRLFTGGESKLTRSGDCFARREKLRC